METKVEGTECVGYSIKDLILYKLDRTLAIVGLVVIAGAAMWADLSEPSAKVVTAVVTALAMYVGGKVVK
jgi:hypothetical protein